MERTILLHITQLIVYQFFNLKYIQKITEKRNYLLYTETFTFLRK
jgi:hypothetical protein